MSKPKKSEIKKLIDSLHADPKGAPADKDQHAKESVHVKNSSGAKKAGIYRPKI